nr:nucleotidyltransferase family protein [uncultured Butyrivibrio sp.]
MEAEDLIYLVSCAVNGVKADPERIAGMDMDELYEQANRHYLTATVAHALETAGVKEERFVKAKKHSALKNAQMDMEMSEVFAELDAAGIWHMPLKGTILQHMYPVYGMRQMSDHDILFDAKRADDVKSIMEKLGFSVEHFGTSHHDVYHKEPVSNFEMHRELFALGSDEKLYEYYRKIQGRMLGDGFEKQLSPEDFYIYMIAHEYKHYSAGGTGLRSLADTYVYLKKNKLDLEYVAVEAKKIGIADFENANRSLARHLFSGDVLTDADKDMLEYILSSGVYGTINHRVENDIQKIGGGKIRYALYRFIGPVSKRDARYDIYARGYPLFYKYKILLIFLPFYRTFRAMGAGRFMREARAIKDAKV